MTRIIPHETPDHFLTRMGDREFLTTDLAKCTGMSQDDARTYMSNMVRKGLATSSGGGRTNKSTTFYRCKQDARKVAT